MIDFKEISYDTDDWELFARDLLSEIGFTIESPPDRGPDQGKDMLALETVTGRLHHYTFRWLVSCKHFATSGKAVNETKDEPNILERMRAFQADGFLGFYSTLASAGLNGRLRELRNRGDIRDYQIFDHKRIEDYLMRLGFSRIFTRYFPNSVKLVRPLHKVLDEYVPIRCDVCGKDLLEALYRENYTGLVAQVARFDEPSGTTTIERMYFACKGKCDRQMEAACWEEFHEAAAWHDLSDLAIPTECLRWIVATLNRLRSGEKYTDEAFTKEKELIMALSQKVFREMTERERQRVQDLLRLPF
jgi:hypothetical protein